MGLAEPNKWQGKLQARLRLFQGTLATVGDKAIKKSPKKVPST